MAERDADVVDLAAGQLERGQTVELRHDDEQAMASQESREPLQIGLATPRTRQAGNEQQSAARASGPVDVSQQATGAGRNLDLLAARTVETRGEPGFRGGRRERQGERGRPPPAPDEGREDADDTNERRE